MSNGNVDFLNQWIEAEHVDVPGGVYEALQDVCDSDIDEEDVEAYCRIKKYPRETVDFYNKLLDYAEKVSGAGMSLVNAPVTQSPSSDEMRRVLGTVIQFVVSKYEGLDDNISSAFLESVLKPEDAQEVWEQTTEQFNQYFDYPEVVTRTIKNMAGRLK